MPKKKPPTPKELDRLESKWFPAKAPTLVVGNYEIDFIYELAQWEYEDIVSLIAALSDYFLDREFDEMMIDLADWLKEAFYNNGDDNNSDE